MQLVPFAFAVVCLLEFVAASTVRRAKGIRGAVGVARRVVQMPPECSHCGTSLVDPFQPTEKYCGEYYDRCDCCKASLQARRREICGRYEGSQEQCVANIRRAIAQKEEACESQQEQEAEERDQRRAQVRDALGHDPYGVNLMLHNSSASGPFDQECAAYSDPSCHETESLCNWEYGCNRQLALEESEYGNVKDWDSMHTHGSPCFR